MSPNTERRIFFCVASQRRWIRPDFSSWVWICVIFTFLFGCRLSQSFPVSEPSVAPPIQSAPDSEPSVAPSIQITPVSEPSAAPPIQTTSVSGPSPAPAIQSTPDSEPSETLLPQAANPTEASMETPAVLVQTPSEVTGVTLFGLLAIIPAGSGSTYDAAAVSAVASTNVRYMRVGLEWAISEPQPGQLSFESRNDVIIQRIEQAGLQVFPTIYVGRGWMNGNPAGRAAGGSRSFPPDDLSEIWSDQYGYSASYYDFISRFFSHYRGHFDYVAIENEANSTLFWGGSSDEYVRLIKTAYKAIKAVDPDVTVVDSGFVSAALGLCIVDDYLNSDLKTEEEIIRFAIDYYQEETGRINIQSASDLEKVLRVPRIQEQCQRINYIIDNLAGSVDAINFHFYEDYRSLPAVVEWLRMRTSRAGYAPGVLSNEVGMRGENTAFAESPELAQEVFKKMITSASLGLEAVILFSADTIQGGKDKVGLFDSDGGMRPAGNTMNIVVETLDAGFRFKTTLSAGPSLYRYVFEDSNGFPSLEALWVEDGQQTLQIKAPPGSSHAMIVDFSGLRHNLAVQGGMIELKLDQRPVFVLWN